MKIKTIYITIIILLLLSACGRETAVTPTAPALIETAVLPSAVPTEQATAVPPTATLPPPPTSTPTAVATATELPATPTAVPSPTPTATIEGMIGPNFGANINPLTGLEVADPAVLQRRPLAIKVSNAPPEVRPQAGLSRADIVFEHLAEGGLTRFTAIFYSQDSALVGSVRSARLIDLEIPVMFDAAFGFSGSSGPIKERIAASSFFDRIISPDFGQDGFFRIPNPDVAFWHTMFTNTANLRAALVERGEEHAPTFANNMLFREEPLQEGTPARRFELWYVGTNATWFYSNGRYLRWSDGEAHLDANNDVQLAFDNVVVIAANHVDADFTEDSNGTRSTEIQIWGEGPVSVFRDGVRIDGRWRRDNPEDMLTFYDLDGNPLPLAPGTTFFHLVPLGFRRLTVSP